MSVMLDVLFSMVLGGMLLLNVLRAQDLTAETSSLYNGDVLVQEMLIMQVQAVEGEFRNMGYGVPSGVAPIVQAGDSSMTFLIDVGRNGTIDTVKYEMGPISELAGTQNEMDRYLRRTEKLAGGATTQANVGVVTFLRMKYITAAPYDTLTSPVATASLGGIMEIELSMEVQNPHALYRPKGMILTGQRDALYSTSYWQQTRLASQNFRR